MVCVSSRTSRESESKHSTKKTSDQFMIPANKYLLIWIVKDMLGASHLENLINKQIMHIIVYFAFHTFFFIYKGREFWLFNTGST